MYKPKQYATLYIMAPKGMWPLRSPKTGKVHVASCQNKKKALRHCAAINAAIKKAFKSVPEEYRWAIVESLPLYR
jgi:hypothetical protein